jgi:hypothetical protein
MILNTFEGAHMWWAQVFQLVVFILYFFIFNFVGNVLFIFCMMQILTQNAFITMC